MLIFEIFLGTVPSNKRLRSFSTCAVDTVPSEFRTHELNANAVILKHNHKGSETRDEKKKVLEKTKSITITPKESTRQES